MSNTVNVKRGRGRPSHDYVLSGKAKSMLALRQYADAVKQVA